MKKKKLSNIFVVLALLVSFSAFLTGTSAASHVSCAQVLTTDTTLDGDLTCTETASGLVFGANNVVLDLGGHTLSGNCAGVNEGPGVRTDGYSGVTVQNGVIKCFDAGVLIEGLPQAIGETRVGGGNTVQNVSLEDNVGDPSTDYGDGVLIAGSSNNRIADSTITRNGPYDGVGVIALEAAGAPPSNANVIEGNAITDNNIAFSSTTNQDSGIRLEPKTTNSVVRNNTISGNGLEGVRVFGQTTGHILENNTVSNNGNHNKAHRKGDGLRVDTGTGSHVRGNVICGNAANGLIVGTAAAVIVNNDVGAGTAGCAANNTQGLSTQNDLRDTTTAPTPCFSNTWVGNYTVGDSTNQDCTRAGSDADVMLTKSNSSGLADLGDDVSYTITATNGGSNRANLVTIADTLPASMGFVSASASQGSCGHSSGTVTCDLGTLAAGASATVTLVVSPTATGTFTNTVSVSASQPDPNSGNNSASSSTTVGNSRGCTIVGTAGDDNLSGTAGNDVVCGLAGNDTVSGMDGHDTLHGGSGNDSLSGDAGKDRVVGNSGSDSLNGNQGSDTLEGVDGVSGNDGLNGGNGQDTCTADLGDAVAECP